MIYAVEGHSRGTKLYAYADRDAAKRCQRAMGGRVVPYVASPIESPTLEEATRLAAEWQHERDMAVDEAAEARGVMDRVLGAIGYRYCEDEESLDECLRRVQRELTLARKVIAVAAKESGE